MGMSPGKGGGGGGIVRLDPNPCGLAAARPQDKLTCRLSTYENASWTLKCFNLCLIRSEVME